MTKLERLKDKIGVIRASRNSRHTQIIEALQEILEVLETMHDVILSAEPFPPPPQAETPGIIKVIKKSNAFLGD